MLFPRKEAIPPLLTQAILGLRQVTAQHLPRQLGTQPGLGLPMQTALSPQWIARSPRQMGLHPLIAPLPKQQAMLVPRKRAIPPTNNSNKQAGSSSGRGNRNSARLRAFQASQENSATSKASSASSQGGNTSPNNSRENSQGSSMEEPNPKWVINLSSKPLPQVQRSVLAKGPNFAVSPRHPPNLST